MADSITETATYEAPMDQVWDLIMDPDRLGDWVSIHDSVEDVPDDGLSEGSTFRQKMKRYTFEFEVRWRIVEIDAPRYARWEGSGPAGSSAQVIYELSESDGKTTFDYSNSFELPGGKVGGAASKVFGAKAASKLARKSLKKLGEQLEKEPA